MKNRSILVAFGLALLAQPAATQAPPPEIEPEAVQATQRMRAFLGTLTTFEVEADTTLDLVLDDGQKIQIEGETTYKVRRPNGFVIENVTNRKVRQFYYDGRQFTVYAPKSGFYAQAPAPATIRQTLDVAYDRYGIALPLEDLFHWSEPGDQTPRLTAAFVVGDATIDDVDTTQYAFRGADRDWQVWIQKGDRPIPRKIVIVDRTDPAMPAYVARLSWNLTPSITAETFAFRPDGNAKAIRLAQAQ